MNSNSKKSSSASKSSMKSTHEKQQADSPMPKLLTQQKIDVSNGNSGRSCTPPPATIQEDDQENENELPPTPPDYPLNQTKITPVDESILFRNIDYNGMSVQELKYKSARRVKVSENGEEEPDITWTEFKQNLYSIKKRKEEMEAEKDKENLKIDEERKNKIENNVSADKIINEEINTTDDEKITNSSIKKNEKIQEKSITKVLNFNETDDQATKIKIPESSHKKSSTQQEEHILRRSERLAKLKSESASKRKMTPGKSSGKKVLKKLYQDHNV